MGILLAFTQIKTQTWQRVIYNFLASGKFKGKSLKSYFIFPAMIMSFHEKSMAYTDQISPTVKTKKEYVRTHYLVCKFDDTIYNYSIKYIVLAHSNFWRENQKNKMANIHLIKYLFTKRTLAYLKLCSEHTCNFAVIYSARMTYP